jgi:hypothetical protein
VTQRTRWILGLCAAAILVPVVGLVSLVTWQHLRDKSLLSFCKAAHAGLTLDELLSLEKHYGVDESYLIQANFPRYIDQAHSLHLEFRSQPIDPDFACAIGHDGRVVRTVQLLTLEGFKPE